MYHANVGAKWMYSQGRKLTIFKHECYDFTIYAVHP